MYSIYTVFAIIISLCVICVHAEFLSDSVSLATAPQDHMYRGEVSLHEIAH